MICPNTNQECDKLEFIRWAGERFEVGQLDLDLDCNSAADICLRGLEDQRELPERIASRMPKFDCGLVPVALAELLFHKEAIERHAS